MHRSGPMIPPPELRELLREMARQLGPGRAAMEWFMDGLPPAPVMGLNTRLSHDYYNKRIAYNAQNMDYGC